MEARFPSCRTSPAFLFSTIRAHYSSVPVCIELVSAKLRVPTMFVCKRWQEPDIIAASFSSVVQLLTEGWLLNDGVSKAEVQKVFRRQWSSRLSLGTGTPQP